MGDKTILTTFQNERHGAQNVNHCSQNAAQLISAAKVFQNLYHGTKNKEPPQNERQARELAKAPPEEQAEVWIETQERTQITQL